MAQMRSVALANADFAFVSVPLLNPICPHTAARDRRSGSFARLSTAVLDFGNLATQRGLGQYLDEISL
jgi:hypothetical protein